MSDTIHLPFATTAVLFDLDDTLHYRSKAFRGWAEWFAQTHLLTEATGNLAAAADLLVELDNHGYTPRETYFQRLRQIYPDAAILQSSIEQLMLLYHTEVRRFIRRETEVYSLLEQFKNSGIPFGIVTNGYASQQQKKIEVLELEKLTSCIFISGAFGARKPAASIFLAAAKRLETSPQQILFVGDHCQNDIWGAHQVGMRTVWIQHHRRTWPNDLPTDVVDMTIHSLAELPTVFQFQSH